MGAISVLEGRLVDCITGSTDSGSDSWVGRLGRRVMEVMDVDSYLVARSFVCLLSYASVHRHIISC